MSDFAPVPVFIHGAGHGVESWDCQMEHFQSAIVLALPGHPDGAPLRSIEALAVSVAAALGDEERPIVCIGHSMGGQVALQMALDAPGMVVGVVVLASGAHISVPKRSRDAIQRDFLPQCERFVRAAYAYPCTGFVEADLASMRAAGQATILADYDALDTWEGDRELRDIRQPVLVVSAEKDRITPPALSAELAHYLPNCRTVQIPDVGHMVHREASQAVNLLISGFLAQVELDLASR